MSRLGNGRKSKSKVAFPNKGRESRSPVPYSRPPQFSFRGEHPSPTAQALRYLFVMPIEDLQQAAQKIEQ